MNRCKWVDKITRYVCITLSLRLPVRICLASLTRVHSQCFEIMPCNNPETSEVRRWGHDNNANNDEAQGEMTAGKSDL